MPLLRGPMTKAVRRRRGRPGDFVAGRNGIRDSDTARTAVERFLPRNANGLAPAHVHFRGRPPGRRAAATGNAGMWEVAVSQERQPRIYIHYKISSPQRRQARSVLNISCR